MGLSENTLLPSSGACRLVGGRREGRQQIGSVSSCLSPLSDAPEGSRDLQAAVPISITSTFYSPTPPDTIRGFGTLANPAHGTLAAEFLNDHHHFDLSATRVGCLVSHSFSLLL